MTTTGMRTYLTLDEIETVRMCVRFIRQSYDLADEDELEAIDDRLSVMLEYAATMYHVADLTIEVRP